MKKFLFFTVLFYFLILLQESFFIHFFPYFPNIVLVMICLINLFEERKDNFGIYLGLIGGFFLDVSGFLLKLLYRFHSLLNRLFLTC